MCVLVLVRFVASVLLLYFNLYQEASLTDALQYPFLFLFSCNPFSATYPYMYEYILDIYYAYMCSWLTVRGE